MRVQSSQPLQTQFQSPTSVVLHVPALKQQSQKKQR